MRAMNKKNTLHGSVKKYEDPTEPVGEDDWSALQAQSENRKKRNKIFSISIKTYNNMKNIFLYTKK